MDITERGNSQAYPTPAGDYGLTKRELFAAMCLNAILSSGDSSRVSFEEYAICATHHADALLAELSKP